MAFEGALGKRRGSAAAKKAAYRACRSFCPNADEQCTVRVTIRETTKQSACKEYHYEAIRQPAKETKKVQFGGAREAVPTTFKYDMKMRSLKKVDG
jgi:hypothetical protein